LLQRELDAAGLHAEVGSAGTGAPFRRPPDRRLLRVADDLGLDLSAHRSEPLTPDLLERADLVLTMTTEHRNAIETTSPEAARHTVTLRAAAWKAQLMRGRPMPFDEWAARLAADVPVAERPKLDPSNDIPDPIGGPMRDYRAMAREVSSLVGTLVARWSGR
jgi:protein-tyrosine phosphatase